MSDLILVESPEMFFLPTSLPIFKGWLIDTLNGIVRHRHTISSRGQVMLSDVQWQEISGSVGEVIVSGYRVLPPDYDKEEADILDLLGVRVRLVPLDLCLDGEDDIQEEEWAEVL